MPEGSFESLRWDDAPLRQVIMNVLLYPASGGVYTDQLRMSISPSILL